MMCVYNEKHFANYVEKVKDLKCDEESEDVPIQGSVQTMKVLWKVTSVLF